MIVLNTHFSSIFRAEESLAIFF